jgi:hypothetical protein
MREDDRDWYDDSESGEYHIVDYTWECLGWWQIG